MLRSIKSAVTLGTRAFAASGSRQQSGGGPRRSFRIGIEQLEERALLASLVGDLYTVSAYDNVFTPLDQVPQSESGAVSYLQANRYLPFEVDPIGFGELLNDAPLELSSAGAHDPFLVSIPAPDGHWHTFDVVESPVMEPELAAQFPEIKTYLGQGVTNPAATVRFDMTPLGFHAQVLSPDGAYYIDPYYHLDQSVYASYFRSDLAGRPPFEDFTVDTLDELDAAADLSPDLGRTEAVVSRRDIRTAITTTTTYNSFFGGTVTNVLSAVTTAINRITGVYEADLAVRLILVADTTRLFSSLSGAGTDNPNGSVGSGSVSTLAGNNQSFTDTRIGNANYDIGHVFHSGGFNGISAGGIGIVGRAGLKARAATSGTPSTDVFYIDYVSHEMGHQFGGRHNFNNCSGGQGDSSIYANEPGSGSTIMGYAGICGSTNIQNNSHAYFNYLNLNQITAYLGSGTPQGLPAPVATSNNTPLIDPLTNYTIPDQTPFRLNATGTDPDGDTISYTWEQANAGSGPISLGSDPGHGPIIRSRPGVTSGERMIPQLANILVGTLPLGETLPLTNRTLNFTVTARDNSAGAGGVTKANMVLTSVNSGTGFSISSLNTTGITWPGGSSQTVMWNVSGSDVAPINTANVRIRLSTDGGNSFPIVLAESTPNDGSATVNMPFNLGTTQARIMVEAVGNIFFDINNRNFTITNVANIPGDFNGDGNLDCADVDALVVAISTGDTNPLYDVTNNGTVDAEDLDFWIVDLKQTLPGDANLDFAVDGIDFTIWNASKFSNVASWCAGDFTGDGSVDGADFLRWNTYKFQAARSQPLVAPLSPQTPVSAQPLAADRFEAGPQAPLQAIREVQLASQPVEVLWSLPASDRSSIATAAAAVDDQRETGADEDADVCDLVLAGWPDSSAI